MTDVDTRNRDRDPAAVEPAELTQATLSDIRDAREDAADALRAYRAARPGGDRETLEAGHLALTNTVALILQTEPVLRDLGETDWLDEHELGTQTVQAAHPHTGKVVAEQTHVFEGLLSLYHVDHPLTAETEVMVEKFGGRAPEPVKTVEPINLPILERALRWIVERLQQNDMYLPVDGSDTWELEV